MLSYMLEVGETRKYKGQVYVCVELRWRAKRKGPTTLWAVWQSQCLECGVPFTFVDSSGASYFKPNRRCTLHKKPGIRGQVDVFG